MHHEDSILKHGADLGRAGVSRDREAVRKAAAGVFDGLALLAVQIEFTVACDGQRVIV